jgi:hypothetical protein
LLADGQTLYIRHRPVPWWGNRDLPAAEIHGIETEAASSNNGHATFSVNANHADGRLIVLLSGLKERQADYIGYHLASHLGVRYARNDSNPQRNVLPTFLKKAFERRSRN